MQTGQIVKFNTDNGERIGTISRVWPKGNLVTIKAEGKIAGTLQTWVREVTSVRAA